MSKYGDSDYDNMYYELNRFLETHTATELLQLVTDAVDLYEELIRYNDDD